MTRLPLFFIVNDVPMVCAFVSRIAPHSSTVSAVSDSAAELGAPQRVKHDDGEDDHTDQTANYNSDPL